jgi:hypothetical protein
MDYGFAKINGASQWYVPRFLSDRKCFPVAFQALFALLLVLLVLVLPESPRWLIQKGRVDEATRVLQRLIGKEVSAEHERVVRLRETIEETVQAAEGADFRYRELLKGGKRKT